MAIQMPSNVAQMRDAWRVINAGERKGRPGFRMVEGDIPKLYVYDMIGGWDLEAADFVKAVHAIDAEAIDVHVNSPGGFVYDAVAMYEALRDHAATVNIKIDGLAASAASFLAMSGDTIEIAKPGRMMIHDAQMLAYGSPADMREAADLGDAISDDIAGIYASRAGGKPKDWRERMTATTWYSSQQAVEAKLVDTVKGSTETENNFDLRTQMIRARARVTLGGVK